MSAPQCSALCAGHGALMVIIIESVAPNQPGESRARQRCNLHKRIVNFSSHLFYWRLVHSEDVFVTLDWSRLAWPGSACLPDVLDDEAPGDVLDDEDHGDVDGRECHWGHCGLGAAGKGRCPSWGSQWCRSPHWVKRSTQNSFKVTALRF